MVRVFSDGEMGSWLVRVLASPCPVAELVVPQASTLCWMRRDLSLMVVMSELWPGGDRGHGSRVAPFSENAGIGYAAV